MTPALLGVITYITFRTSAFIAIIVFEVTTANPQVESSRSFKISINTRISKHPALLEIIDSLSNSLFASFIHFVVYSIYLDYES